MRIIHQAEMDGWDIRGTKRYIENGTNQYQKGGTHTKIGMQQRREKEQVLFHHVKTDVVLDQISLIWSISETAEENKELMVVLTLAH